MNNLFEKNKSAVILNPEAGVKISGASVEPVINEGAKTKRYSAKRDLYGDFAFAQPLKMTEKALSLSGASSEPIISAESKKNQPRYSVNCCAIPEYDRFGFGFAKVKALSFLRLRGASGAQGISATASCRKAHKRRFLLNQLILHFANASLRMTIPALAFLLSLNLSTAFADCNCDWGGEDGKTLTIKGCSAIWSSSCADEKKTANNVIIGTGVTSIGNDAFNGASSLTNITIPDSVTSIGSQAFSGAYNLTSITIPKGVTSIGYRAFYYASSLTSITIPEGVTYIGGGAFDGARSLTSITIPDSVTSIGSQAFQSAYRLTSITIPDSVKSIGSDAFYGTYLTNIMCKGDETSCADTVNALRKRGYKGNISYPTDKTSCEGSDISLYVWNGSKCSRRNEEQCNSVAKYYYSDEKCQVLPKTQSACTGTNIEWNATDNKCVNKNYTPTGGDDIGDISGDFNPADCYNKGQVPYNNQCWDEYPFAKKRWTPAEANQWLHDGNDNFVVITFKK